MDPWGKKDAALRVAILAMEEAKHDLDCWIAAAGEAGNRPGVAVSRERVELLNRALEVSRKAIAT